MSGPAGRPRWPGPAALAVAALGGVALAAAALSLSWRMTLDTPYMMFLPYQWQAFGLVPYLDVFDHNAPGGFVIAGLALALGGTSDQALRALDLAWLLATGGLMAAALRRFGALVGAAGALLFAVFYLGLGPLVSFQREFQLLAPLALAIAASAPPAPPTARRALLAGLGLGVAATIKPAVLIALPPLAAWWWRRARLVAPSSALPGDKRAAGLAPRACLAALAGGVALPLVTLGAALAAIGALGPYLEIVRGYYPLYNELSGDNLVLGGREGLAYRLQETAAYLAGKKRWLAFAALGLAAGWRAAASEDDRRLVLTIAGALALGVAYAAALGKFFDYHWLPFHFAAALAGALLLAPPGPGRAPGRLAVAAFVAFAALCFRPSPDVAGQWRGDPVCQPELVRVDALASAIRARLRPGEAVQILDWSNGGIHAALLAGARTATPFYLDLIFYHHVSTPYTQALRARFLAAFDAARPALVVRVAGPPARGPDTVGAWAALEERLGRDYRVAEAQLGYVLYARRTAEAQ